MARHLPVSILNGHLHEGIWREAKLLDFCGPESSKLKSVYMVLTDEVIVECNGLSYGLVVLFIKGELHSVWKLYWILRWGFDKPCNVGHSMSQ